MISKSRIFVAFLLIGIMAISNLSLSAQVGDPSVTVNTFAGSGVRGDLDGPGASARFWGPTRLAIDAVGNVYVTDNGNNKIRKIAPDGTVSTLAGTGVAGSNDGPGNVATFSDPYGIAVDTAGNVYVSEWGNHKIRKIAPDGTVSTLAGTGASGSINGPGATATFWTPSGLAVDTSGNVFVADSNNNKIRMIAPDGFVTTYAGSGITGSADGVRNSATFHVPSDVAFDAAGNLYVTDRGNQKIRKIATNNIVSTLAGSGAIGADDGPGNTATFRSLQSLVVDNVGNIYVADGTSSNKIRKVAPDGFVSTLAGTGAFGDADGAGDVATFNGVHGLTLDASGNIFVADTGNEKIRLIQGAIQVVGCFVAAPEDVFEGETFTATVQCDNLSENVYGFEFGTSFSGDITTSASSYTPGTFVTDAQPNVIEAQNSLSLYALSRSTPATEATGSFTLGSVDYDANLGLSADGSATITLNPFLLGDIFGDEVIGVLATNPDATITIKDLLSSFGTLQSEINVNALNNPTVTIDLQTATTPSVVGNSFAFDFDDVFPTNSPVLFADAESHLECSQTLNLSVSDTDLGTLTILAGDVTDDGDSQTPATIDLLDAVQVGIAIFGGATGEEDINADGAVNVLDLISVGRNYNVVSGTCF